MTEYDPRDRPTAKMIMEDRYFAVIDWQRIADDKYERAFKENRLTSDVR